MLAILVLLLAALSRLLPHSMHAVGLNFTAVGAGLLFFGSRRPRWQAVLAAAVMALTDIYLTKAVYGLPFHASAYVMTWAWYAAVCLIGSSLLLRSRVEDAVEETHVFLTDAMRQRPRRRPRRSLSTRW